MKTLDILIYSSIIALQFHSVFVIIDIASKTIKFSLTENFLIFFFLWTGISSLIIILKKDQK